MPVLGLLAAAPHGNGDSVKAVGEEEGATTEEVAAATTGEVVTTTEEEGATTTEEEGVTTTEIDEGLVLATTTAEEGGATTTEGIDINKHGFWYHKAAF